MKAARPEYDPGVRVVHGRVPAWLALLLVGPAVLLFVLSLTVLLVGGLVAAALLPLLQRRFAPAARGADECIELDPEEFRTVERRDSFPPP